MFVIMVLEVNQFLMHVIVIQVVMSCGLVGGYRTSKVPEGVDMTTVVKPPVRTTQRENPVDCIRYFPLCYNLKSYLHARVYFKRHVHEAEMNQILL